MSQQNKKATYQSLCKCNYTTSWNDIKWNVDLELDVNNLLKGTLGTSFYLKKTNKISNSDICRICHEQTETLVHV